VPRQPTAGHAQRLQSALPPEYDIVQRTPTRARARQPAISLSESEGLRHLHVGGTAIQSAMHVDAPDDLALAYTRAMMACLLFDPHPRDVLMIGLGGGSLAKYVYRRLPRTRIVAVEVDLRVVRAAHAHFRLPLGRQRLKVIVGDGAQYAERHPDGADLILLDAFVNHRQAPTIRTAAFYATAARALRPGGMLVINFMLDDPGLRAYLRRLGKAFGGRVACLRAWGEDNVIAIAFKDDPGPIAPAVLAAGAAALEARFGLEFRDFAMRIRPADRMRLGGAPLLADCSLTTRPARPAPRSRG